MLLLTTVVLFVLSTTLFLVDTLRRHQLDLALKRAAAPDRQDVENVPQLGLKAWRPNVTGVALNQPERRCSYDQAYIIAFVNALLSQRVPIAGAANRVGAPLGHPALEYYEGPILILDMWFAVSFAVFIVCCASFIAEIASFVWVQRLFTIGACLGAVYGAADVAEDVKLRSILRHARTATSAHNIGAPDDGLVDAAEVDAANALTRIKIVTIMASIVGFFGFIFLWIASDILVRISGRSVRRTQRAATS